MTPKLLLAVLLFAYPVKPDMSLKFKDISVSRAMSLAKTFGVDAELPFKVEGRIGLLAIEFRGKLVQMKLERVTLDNDSTKEPMIRQATAAYNRTTKEWNVRAEALGGLIEVEGVMPK